MSRKASVYLNSIKVGILEEIGDTFSFNYDQAYLARVDSKPISLTFPLTSEAYISEGLHPFFCGLLAEGVNKEMQCRLLKIDEHDLFGLLLKTADKDTIGAVTVRRK